MPALAHPCEGVPRHSRDVLGRPEAAQIADAVAEVERLSATQLSDAVGGTTCAVTWRLESHDWLDFAEMDWPCVKPDIEAGVLADTDPTTCPTSTRARLLRVTRVSRYLGGACLSRRRARVAWAKEARPAQGRNRGVSGRRPIVGDRSYRASHADRGFRNGDVGGGPG
jgi:hypothetical protein